MPAISAPSAKILMFNAELFTRKAYASRVKTPDFLGENPIRRVRQIIAAYRRRDALRTLVQRTDLDGSTSCRASGCDVPPPVAHHETAITVNVESLHCLKEHPRLRL